MWISWWTNPLRKVGSGTYDSAPSFLSIRWNHRFQSENQSSITRSGGTPPCRSGPRLRLRDRSREDPSTDPPRHDVAAFIRFCHGRKQSRLAGWRMTKCARLPLVEFNGWDHDQFAARSLTFNLFEMPRLSG